MRIGFIGFGEVSYEMSKGFIREGVEEIHAYDPLYENKLIQDRVKELNVNLYSDPAQVAIQHLDVLITAVPAQYALNAWEKIRGSLDHNTIYVDVSTAGASVKNDVYEAIMNKQHYFVDVALMGPLSVHQHQVPVFASGNGTDKLMEIMQPYNMNIEKISDRIGDATNIKFIRSIYTKGLSMLLIEVLQLANKLDLEDIIIESMAKTMNEKPFEDIINRLITGSAIHSERREAEMENVISFVEANNESPIMAKATNERLAEITTKGLKQTFNNETPNNWRAVIEELNSKRGVIYDENK